MKVTKDMIEAFIGSDQEACKYLEEIVNGEYKAEQFREDVLNYNSVTPVYYKPLWLQGGKYE